MSEEEPASSIGDAEPRPDVAGTMDGAAAVGSGKRLPEFFIVGHQKCGTTALNLMLSMHPQIFTPDVKELRFFAPELRSRFRRLGPRKLPESLDDYLSRFAAADAAQRVGEASPSYLRSRTAASRIAAVQPDARIIAILREPASYLRSFHLQCVHNHMETQKDFAKAMALEEVRRQGKRIPRFSQSPPALLYSDHVRYVEQLCRYHAVFPPEQVLVLIYEDFRRDNEAMVRTVLRFLEVDDTLPVEPIKTQPLQGVRSLRMLQLGMAQSIARRRAASGGPLLKTLEALTPHKPRNRTYWTIRESLVYGPQRPPDEGFMRELRRRFKPEVVALSDYLGRDLVTLWGYDDLG